MLPQLEGDPTYDFGTDWIEAWMQTENYRIWDKNTDSHLFDIVEPKHPCAGGLTIDDVQRRLAQQVQELHLDERFAVGKEVLGRNLAAGKERASSVFNKLYNDMELLRENQRRRRAEQAALAEHDEPASPAARNFVPDLSKAQATAANVGSMAGAYMSSWASWAGEKKKGWGTSSSTKRKSEEGVGIDFTPRDITPKASITVSREAARPGSETVKAVSASPQIPRATFHEEQRPQTQESYKESIFDADSETDDEEVAKIEGKGPSNTTSLPDTKPITALNTEPPAAPLSPEPIKSARSDSSGKVSAMKQRFEAAAAAASTKS
jgi:hypothetical protein